MKRFGAAIAELENLIASDEAQKRRHTLLEKNKTGTEIAAIDFQSRNTEINRRLARRQAELTIMYQIRDHRVLDARIEAILKKVKTPKNKLEVCRAIGGYATPYLINHMIKSGMLCQKAGAIWAKKKK